MRSLIATCALVLYGVLPAAAGAPAVVPEPGTMLLVGAGLAATILYVRKKKNQK
jgi:hypothetical protein